MDFIKEFIENDKFAKSVGIELLEVSLGYAKAKWTKIFTTIRLTLYCGAIFTLADFTFAVAANTHNKMSVALIVNISFLKAISEGVLIAEAQEISVNPKIATYKILVSNDLGEIIATFEGMAYRKERSLVKE